MNRPCDGSVRRIRAVAADGTPARGHSSLRRKQPAVTPEPAPTTSTTTAAWWHNPPKWIWLLTVAVGLGGWANFLTHHSEVSATATNTLTNSLIDAKLNPAKDAINTHTDEKVGALGAKIDTLSDRVSRIEGHLDRRVSSLETKSDHYASLARLQNPDRVLALIRDEINNALVSGKALPSSNLADYRNALLELPQTSLTYWTTAAAIINYQSKLSQMNGVAPDPVKVSKTCAGITYGSGSHNRFEGQVFSDCIVDLDKTNDQFVNVMFRDSVIRYSGGSDFVLRNVRFVNCNFQITVPPNHRASKMPNLLQTLLQSPNQESIVVR